MRGKPRTGLVSVSFRNKSAEEILELCGEAGLDFIEWGGDAHVPAGDGERAEEVRRLTEEAGLKTCSYGSYYKLGTGRGFEEVLASAKALKAPVIRVWAGERGSRDVDEEYYDLLVKDGVRIRNLALREGIRVFTEYHRKTMTDTIASCLRLMKDTGLNSYWQPNPEISYEERLKEITRLAPQIEIVHVFAWTFAGGENRRHMLLEQRKEWEAYSRIAGRDRIYLLEFSKDDDDRNTIRDAETLTSILRC